MEYKGFEIVTSDELGLKRIKTIGRGALPAKLRGRFTSIKMATDAIDAYEAAKPKGKKRNDEADINSTD